VLCQWPRRFFDRPERSRRYIGELRDLDTEVTLFWKDRKGRVGDSRSQRAGLYKTFVNACAGCALRGPCEGPWKRYVELYGDGEFRAFETSGV
jgi:hypothetical protein